MSASDDLLARIPEDERAALVPLLHCAPIVERLTGHRPHRSALHRWATRRSGPRLRCVVVPGAGRLTCAAWLVAFFAALAEVDPAPEKKARPRGSRGRAGSRRAPAPKGGRNARA